MIKASPEERTLPPFHPIEGIEAEPITYYEWLLLGGFPIDEFHVTYWAETQPGGLT